MEWNSQTDSFRPTVSSITSVGDYTKWELVLDIARLYDVLGWCSLTIVLAKILLQGVWEEGWSWNEPVSWQIRDTWEKWRSQLPMLQDHLIPRTYFPKQSIVASKQLHGFSNASESAYAGAIYLKAVDSIDNTHIALVMAKTRVAPIKRLTIPRLELSGALVTAKLLHHCRKILDVSLSVTFAWTDSTIILSWLRGNPGCFEPLVGNRVAQIVELIPSHL